MTTLPNPANGRDNLCHLGLLPTPTLPDQAHGGTLVAGSCVEPETGLAGARVLTRRHLEEMIVTTRNLRTLVPLPALLPALAGCVLALDSIVPESGAIFDPRLVGTWEDSSSTDRAVISRASDQSYAIEHTSDGKVSRLQARLDSLGGRLVLDVWATPVDGDVPELYAGLMVAGHALLVLDIGADEVRAAALELDSLLIRLRTEQPLLPLQHLDGQLVIHGTTDQLRAALGPHLASPSMLTAPSVWRRVAGGGPAGPPAPVAIPCFEASAWRDADQLFQRDPHWVGGDGASSVSLGDGRILWLFGDSWIDPTGAHTRQGARMISNSVAIQTGTDPATASIQFHWRRAADGSPAAIVPDEPEERHWFGNGVRVGDRLILFLNRVRNTTTGTGFESVGWAAWLVENPDADPSTWRMVRLTTPTNPLGVLVGFAAVLPLGEYVYAFGSQDPVKSHPIHAVRWPTQQVGQGDLANPEWWAGDRLGWVADSSAAPRQPIFENGQSELTIHRDTETERFLAFHTQGFGPADVMIRAAPALTGPWSGPRMLFRPADFYRPNVMIYSAKAHPELTGADLVLTYSTNSFEFAEHLSDARIYYPRFVRLARCASDGGHD